MKNTKIYNELVQKMRSFFLERGFIEVPTQSRLSILAACENPHSVKTFEYGGLIWPLPQTGQMWLEYELVFQLSSYRLTSGEPLPNDWVLDEGPLLELALELDEDK